MRRRQRHCRSPGRPFADGLVQVGAGRDGPLLSPLLRRKSKCDAKHSLYFSPLDLNKRKQNEKVGDLCVRYSIVWGVLCYATASRVTDFTTAHGQLPRRVKGDSAPSPAGPGDFPFYLHPTAIIRVTQIYLFDTDKTATLLLCMHTQRKREFPRSIFFFCFCHLCVYSRMYAVGRGSSCFGRQPRSQEK